MYQGIASLYDKYTNDVDYDKLVNFADKVISDSHVFNKDQSKLVLDLGCGTGAITFGLANMGYDMIGLDISQEMLNVALEKSSMLGRSDILWLNQDMANFELFGTVGAIVCLMDGTNHITNKWDFKRLFKLVDNYLDESGVFIFDMLTERYFNETIGNQIFCESDDEGSCIWSSNYDKKNRICTYDITCYTKDDKKDNTFRRSDDITLERAWTHKEILQAISPTKLEICNTYSDTKLHKPGDKDLRRYYCCTKRR